MSIHYAIAVLVALARFGELILARRNTRRLLAQGGVEAGAGHYPLLVALHVAWLSAIILGVPPGTPANLGLLAMFLALQGARVWIIASLGEYWTTRIITVPGAPLVSGGPYRLLRHPNYVVVTAEMAVLPMVFGAWQIALVFSALNLCLLAHRVRVEEAALADRR